MPGILPMKVIQVGTNAQSRIAQACDRCRSKKIRCDGVRPCCSQCASVGFECKTSDKLSRRAFPRGYTESLEEKVRKDQAQIHELQELLDKRDEKIEMLSRIHSHSSLSIRRSLQRTPSYTPEEPSGGRSEPSPGRDDALKVQQSTRLFNDGANSYFCGTSSARTLVEGLISRVQETGRSLPEIDVGSLLAYRSREVGDASDVSPNMCGTFKPPRLLSDQLVNVFFQEWAPLFPALHRPTFLTLYAQYVADYESVTDKSEIAQLNLVFAIASLSSGTVSASDLARFESQWKAALTSILPIDCITTLQSLILAQIFCLQQGDHSGLLMYNGVALRLATRLGLNQSQRRFTLGTLECETRKKVFWTLYTVDRFTAATLGLPTLLKDDDIHCEYPVDADDEYVTERGFQPTLPGEFTKVSSAIALFRASRILSRALDEVFPSSPTYTLSLKKLSELVDELDGWESSLPSHLRLQFVRDKPSTGTIHSRSPFLSFAYHYIRALLQRPVLCATLCPSESPHLALMAVSCKRMIQTIELLRERGLCFSFCLNLNEVLVISGLGLLFQGLNLDRNSKVVKENAQTLGAVTSILEQSSITSASEFQRVTKSLIPIQQTKGESPLLSKHSQDIAASVECQSSSSKRNSVKSTATRSRKAIKSESNASEDDRRIHAQQYLDSPQISTSPPSQSSIAPSTRSELSKSPVISRSSQSCSIASSKDRSMEPHAVSSGPPHGSINLDYLSFGPESQHSRSDSHTSHPDSLKAEPDWAFCDRILDTFDAFEATSADSLDDARYSFDDAMAGYIEGLDDDDLFGECAESLFSQFEDPCHSKTTTPLTTMKSPPPIAPKESGDHRKDSTTTMASAGSLSGTGRKESRPEGLSPYDDNGWKTFLRNGCWGNEVHLLKE